MLQRPPFSRASPTPSLTAPAVSLAVLPRPHPPAGGSRGSFGAGRGDGGRRAGDGTAEHHLPPRAARARTGDHTGPTARVGWGKQSEGLPRDPQPHPPPPPLARQRPHEGLPGLGAAQGKGSPKPEKRTNGFEPFPSTAEGLAHVGTR